MSRKVFVSSDISIDERLDDVASEDALAALLWPWFLTCFDDWGRSEASPKRLKNKVFPGNHLVTPEVIETALQLYHKYGLLKLYEVDGKRYMAVDQEKWFKYQTHIRREKREKDNSKYPAPEECAQFAEDSVQMRADARDSAKEREDARICTPSPSPSPSPSGFINTTTTTNARAREEEPEEVEAEQESDCTTAYVCETINEAHTKVFNTLFIPPVYGQLYSELLGKGWTEQDVIELILEAGESTLRPSPRYLQEIAERWQREGIRSREAAQKRREGGRRLRVVGGNSGAGPPPQPPPKAFTAPDDDITRLMYEAYRAREAKAVGENAEPD